MYVIVIPSKEIQGHNMPEKEIKKMKNTMKRPLILAMAVMMATILMLSVFSISAKADFNSYIGTWECCEHKELGARFTVYGNGTITLFSTKNPAYSSNYTYGINNNGFMSTSNGTVFAPNGFNHLIDSNGYHWDRIW